jgi:hypothetical protein
MHLHIPVGLLDDFKAVALRFLPPGVDAIDDKAILVDGIGWTDPARQGALNYLCKGVAKKAGMLLGIEPKDQGRVYGKRHFVSESLGVAARRRHATELVPVRTDAAAA